MAPPNKKSLVREWQRRNEQAEERAAREAEADRGDAEDHAVRQNRVDVTTPADPPPEPIVRDESVPAAAEAGQQDSGVSSDITEDGVESDQDHSQSRQELDHSHSQQDQEQQDDAEPREPPLERYWLPVDEPVSRLGHGSGERPSHGDGHDEAVQDGDQAQEEGGELKGKVRSADGLSAGCE